MLRKAMVSISLFVFVICAISTVAVADWDPGDPAKWVQLPDLTPEGMDVLASHPKVLADDFLCDVTGALTDIHIWGSWFEDLLPQNATGVDDPTAVGFRLSIHSDIPAGPTGEYSRPGELLWETFFAPGTFTAREYSIGQEGWFDPNTGAYYPIGDTVAWQYNFLLDPTDTFIQKGTVDNPIVYWLDVEAFPVPDVIGVANALFGWKTSRDHWNDDGVYSDPDLVPPVPWQELIYPLGHPYEGQSIDLAFVINGVPEPATISMLALGGLFTLLRRRRS